MKEPHEARAPASVTSPRSLLVRLLGGVLRLVVVGSVYVAAAAAGAAVGAVFGAVDGLGAMLLGAVGGALALPVALTVGFVGWLAPAAFRIAWRGDDPELELVVPARRDGLVMVALAPLCAAALAYLLPLGHPWGPEVGLAVVAALGAAVIVLAGARRVAEIWLAVVAAAVQAAAG